MSIQIQTSRSLVALNSKIFLDRYENRIVVWSEFRQHLETADNPIQDVIDFWNHAPISARSCDPFDKSTWLAPWDLIESNNYCEFSKILAIYYTLVLTDKFKDSYFEIQIINDRNAQELKYILLVDDSIIGYFYNRAVTYDEVPIDITIQAYYPMLKEFS